MRKLLALLLILCVTALTHASVVKIGSASELWYQIEGDPYSDIQLTADIDLTQYATYPGVFCGTIDGCDTIDGKVTMHRLYGGQKTLFATMNNATIRNIVVDKFNVKAGYEAGVVANKAYDCRFENLIFSGVGIASNSSSVGCITGVAKGCTFYNILFMGCHAQVDGSGVGLITGDASSSTFDHCTVNTKNWVFADGSYDNAYAGGLVGSAGGCTFKHCINMGAVCADDDRVGGIVGASSNTNIWSCLNGGLVMQGELEQLMAAYNHATKSLDELYAEHSGPSGEEWGHLIWEYIEHGVELSKLLPVSIAATAGAVSLTVVSVTAAVYVGYIIYEYQEPDEVGGICGYASGGLIRQCINAGVCDGLDAYNGGIVGYAENGDNPLVIKDCLNQGYVNGNQQTGGIVGTLKSGSVRTCLNVGQVNVEFARLNQLFGTTYVGSVYGEKGSDGVSVGNRYIYSDNDHNEDGRQSVTVMPLASGQIAMDLNADGDNADAWRQNVCEDKWPVPDSTHHFVTRFDIKDDVDVNYYVTNADELYFAVANPYASVVLLNDIDLGDRNSLCSERWKFQGILDGQGNLLTGLSIQNVEEQQVQDVGLFTFANGATFRDVTINACDVMARYNVGALVGNSSNCRYDNVRLLDRSSVKCYQKYCGGLVGLSNNDTFTNCHVGPLTKVYCDGAGIDAIVGGFAGQAVNTTFANSDNSANVVGNDDRVGGFTGEAQDCLFTECTNHGTIEHESTGFFSSDDEVGGISGYSNGSTFIACANYGKINAADAYIGGIVGYAEKSNKQKTWLNNCLNVGDVAGDDHVGGIAGYFVDSQIDNSLNIGTVTGDSEVGDVFGANSGSCQWHNNYYKSATYVPGSGGRCGVTTDQLMSGQVAWWLNESNGKNKLWTQNIGTDDYPELGEQGVHHQRPYSGQIETICLPFDAMSDDGGEFYVLTEANEQYKYLRFSYVEMLPAGTPALYKPVSIGDQMFDSFGTDFKNMPGAVAVSNDWAMEGTYSRLTGDNSSPISLAYWLFLVKDSFITRGYPQYTVEPYTAYFLGPDYFAHPNDTYSIVLDRPTTPIQDIHVSNLVDDTVIFDVMGRKLQSPQPGINIINGKKVLVK